MLFAGSVVRKKLNHRLTHFLEFGPQLLEDLGGHPLALADESEEDVLGPDVVVAELEGFAQAQLQHLLGPRSERNVA